ncbi:hypothetical protein [Acinetobacter baumannii]|uniref:hypothetical protein n=1 Tax=Acinetobacter baumannii TaxID=470 RepID=UPI001D18A2DE|nr:hypothetical protein [Acinetobacter baumannii]MDC4550012.1 hypothetical protein [Acinetobacter baumannii]MDC5109800.1 hypothetical protein [Acinetobacter baumannii]
MNNDICLKLICGTTGNIFNMPNCRIENDRVIYSTNLDAPIKIGDVVVKTWDDGYEEKFTVINFGLSKLLPSLRIDIK